MYKYDEILMGNEAEAMNFLIEKCGMEKEYALKFLERYRKKKEYELQALSMETDVTVVEDEFKDMTSEIDERLGVSVKK